MLNLSLLMLQGSADSIGVGNLTWQLFDCWFLLSGRRFARRRETCTCIRVAARFKAGIYFECCTLIFGILWMVYTTWTGTSLTVHVTVVCYYLGRRLLTLVRQS